MKPPVNITRQDLEFSERQIQACESWVPADLQEELNMVLRADVFKPSSTVALSGRFELVPVQTHGHWQRLLDLRCAIEVPFGIMDVEQVRGLIKDIHTKHNRLRGRWYLARYADAQGVNWVGSIGMIPFHKVETQWMRLQDVDIIPAYQGQGLGRYLLRSACEKAFMEGAVAVGLRAVSTGWVKDWYQRFGFEVL